MQHKSQPRLQVNWWSLAVLWNNQLFLAPVAACWGTVFVADPVDVFNGFVVIFANFC